jgi:hypothetical protein
MINDEQLDVPPTAEANTSVPPRLTRRHLFKVLAGLGIGSTVFQRALAAQGEQTPAVTVEMIRQAEWIAGL